MSGERKLLCGCYGDEATGRITASAFLCDRGHAEWGIAVCSCSEVDDSDGSASGEDNPRCPWHGWEVAA